MNGGNDIIILQTEMCHEWRELGNILVLCMQIEVLHCVSSFYLSIQ